MQTAHKDIPRRVRKAIIAGIKARRFVVMLRTPPRPAAAITAACSSASALGLGTLCNAWSPEPRCPHFPALMFCSTPGCCVLLPERRWAYTSPQAVELQLLGKINVSNFGALGQSGCALLGISPSGSVSPPPGRSQAQGWALSSAGGGLQAVLRMRQVTGLPAPPAAEAGSLTAAQRLSCSQALLEPTPHRAELPLHQEQGQTMLLQLHLHSKNLRVLQNAQRCRKHATTACHSTAEGTLYKAAPANAWLPQPLGIPKAGKKKS